MTVRISISLPVTVYNNIAPTVTIVYSISLPVTVDDSISISLPVTVDDSIKPVSDSKYSTIRELAADCLLYEIVCLQVYSRRSFIHDQYPSLT